LSLDLLVEVLALSNLQLVMSVADEQFKSKHELFLDLIKKRREEEAVVMLGEEKDLCTVASSGNVTALHWASMAGLSELQKALVSAGADIDALNDENEVPLYWATRSGSHEMVGYLLDAGADIVGTDVIGMGLYHHAALSNNIALFERVDRSIKATQSMETGDKEGKTPLMYALEKAHTHIVQWLLFKGASVDTVDANGMTPLHWAVIGGERRCIHALFRAGAEKHLLTPDANGFTPEELCLECSRNRHITTNRKFQYLRLHKWFTEIDGLFEWRTQSGLLRKHIAEGPYFGYQKYLAVLYCMFMIVEFFLYFAFMAEYTRHWMFWSVFFYITFGGHVFFWIRLVVSDPGYLVHGASKTYKPIPGLENLAKKFEGVIKGTVKIDPDDEICLTCKIVRPERSKHCSASKKCIDRFDLFVPVVNKAIGRKNLYYYLAFLFFSSMSSLGFNVMYYAYLTSLNGGQTYWQGIKSHVLFSIISYGYFAHFLTMINWVIGHLDFIRLGYTANEVVNGHRYKYLTNQDNGTMANPYETKSFTDEVFEVYHDCGKDTHALARKNKGGGGKQGEDFLRV
jgi:palmitoyltransferase ZDHHC13/17